MPVLKLKQKIFELENIIITFPLSGRIVPEENNEKIREHFVFSYRVIYEILNNNHIAVIAVIHGKQLPRPLKQN